MKLSYLARRVIFVALLLVFALVAHAVSAAEISCPRCSMWIDDCKGEPIQYDRVLDDLATANVIYLGERHTLSRHHDIQAQVVRDLAKRNVPLLLGIEMMEQPNQDSLDKYCRGEIDFEELAKVTKWKKRWRNYQQYKEVLEAAKQAGAPIVALNARAETIRSVARSGGLDGLDEKLRKELPEEIQLDDQVYKKVLLPQMQSHMAASPERLRPMIEAQICRDEAMADTLCNFLKTKQGKGRTAIVLCGAGHVAHGLGTPARVRRRMPELTERIVIFSASGDVKLSKKELAMTRPVHVPREKVRKVNLRIADYLHVTSLAAEQKN